MNARFVLESVHDFYNFQVIHMQFYLNGNPGLFTHKITLCVSGNIHVCMSVNQGSTSVWCFK